MAEDGKGGGDTTVVSASIEETNRMRAELGLKPLRTGAESAQEGSSKNPKRVKPEAIAPQHDDEDHHETAKIRSQAKGKYSSLGEALASKTGELSTEDWIKQMRTSTKKKKQSSSSTQGKKRGNKAATMNQKNPISETAEEEEEQQANLAGLKVRHGAEQFQEGNDTILTLADKNVLDDSNKNVADDDDELENVDVAEREKVQRKRERKEKASKPVYIGYDDEEFSTEANRQMVPKKFNILSQYDDNNADQENGPVSVFTSDGRLVPADSHEARQDAEEARKRLQSASKKRKIDLTMNFQTSSEFQTKEEAEKELEQLRAKKAKKDGKKKKNKKLRKSKDADELDADEQNDKAPEELTSSKSLVAELQANANGQDESRHRGSRSQREGRGQKRLRETEAAELQSRKKFEQAVEFAQEKADAKVSSGASASDTTSKGEASSSTRTLTSGAPTLGRHKSKVSQFTGHRVYNWIGKNSAIASDEAEEVLDDDEDLWRSINRSAQANAAKKPKTDDDGDDEDTGAAQAASFIKQLQSQRKEVDKQKMLDDGGAEEGLVFTTTTEFSRRLQSQVENLHNEGLQNRTNEKAARSREEEERDEEEALSSQDVSMNDNDGQDGNNNTNMHSGDLLGFEEVAAKGGAASALELLRQTGELSSGTSKEYSGRANDPKPTWEGSGDDPAPNIKLEYKDEFGRKLTTKEAYRQLCYRFHGVQKGKRKRDKQLREIVEQSGKNPSAAVATGKLPGQAAKALDVVHRAKEKSGRAFVNLGKGAS